MPRRWSTEGDPARRTHAVAPQTSTPDALKVLYRLRQSDHIAYLVGGSVRDLLLGRRPRISTSALRRIPTRSRSSSGTAGSSGGASASPSQVRHEGHRGRHVPAPVQPGEEIAQDGVPVTPRRAELRREAPRSRPPSRSHRRPRLAMRTRGQHVRHARGGRVPPRLHHQRALLRHRHLFDHRLHRRPGRPAGRRRAMDRRSRRALSSRTPCA